MRSYISWSMPIRVSVAIWHSPPRKLANDNAFGRAAWRLSAVDIPHRAARPPAVSPDRRSGAALPRLSLQTPPPNPLPHTQRGAAYHGAPPLRGIPTAPPFGPPRVKRERGSGDAYWR